MLSLSSGQNLVKTVYQVSHYTIEALSNSIINKRDSVTKRRNALEITGRNSKTILDNLNVKIEAKFSRPGLLDRNYFMVCNHMSYLDILVLSSIRPAMFVTSVEMEKTFFLGDMAKLGGSFFVDRVNRRKMKDEVDALVQLLNQGFNVFIFPEGTSTDGSHILPFKKSLFRVPYQTQFPILPICLKYVSVDGEPFSPQNCDRVCWYGDMNFGPHFLQLMNFKELTVEVQYMDPLDPKDYPSHGDLALAAEKVIKDAYFGKS